MPKASKGAFYAVHKGHMPGVYTSWADCAQQVEGYPSAAHKRFASEAEAKAFVKFGFAMGKVAVAATGDTMPSARNLSSASLPVVKAGSASRKQDVRVADITNERGWDVVYTDGACRGNGKDGAVAGIGVWWEMNDPRNLAERCPGDQTNNRAELIAIIRALETAPQGGRPLLIKTDSSYSISCIQDWEPSWRKRKWKTADGKDVKNKAVIMYLVELLSQRGQKGQKVHLQHVRGHVGILGNQGADALAGLGASMPAKPERDWALASKDPEDTGEDAAADFPIDVEEILSVEDLDKMAAEGEFD